MPRITLKFDGVAGTADLTTQFGCAIVGSGAVLADGSNATYANYTGGGGNVFSTVEVSPVLVPATNYTVQYRLKTTMATGDAFNVYIDVPGSGVYADHQYFADPAPTAEAGWLVGDMDVTSPTNLANGFNGSTNLRAQIEMLGPAAVVYEAQFVVEWGGETPPCRLFPRADGLGVGSGRHFPPAKSQQRSGRRFGYY